MPVVSMRTVLWIGRLLCVVVVLWWPAVWRDPIYSPRQARMSGQELRLPDTTTPKNEDDRALAIFWAWEHRQLVKTRWTVGPYLGLRTANPTAWKQTLLVTLSILLVFSFFLSHWKSESTVAESTRSGRIRELLSIPLAQLFRRPRR